tara:strand:- start:958 stop:1086 length:129 start_codon:yes stop_codon:yes gene_type:complete
MKRIDKNRKIARVNVQVKLVFGIVKENNFKLNRLELCKLNSL